MTNVKNLFTILFSFSLLSIYAQDLVWAKKIGYWGAAVFVDSSGNSYYANKFLGVEDMDPGNAVNNHTSNGGYDVVVVKLDATGNFLWSKQFGGSGDETAQFISVDSIGNIYISGNYALTVDFDPGVGVFNATSNGGLDLYILKLDSLGNFLWVKTIGGNNDELFRSCAITSNSIVYSGDFLGLVDFDPGGATLNLSSGTGKDVFMSKLSLTGNFIWAKRIGGTMDGWASNSLVDDHGNIYLSGEFFGTFDFDPDAGVYNLSSPSGFDVFIAKYDSNGNFLWANQIVCSSGGSVSAEGMAVGANGVYLSGAYNGTISFNSSGGGFNFYSSSIYSSFIMKMDSTGGLIWVKDFNYGNYISILNLKLDNEENLYSYFSFKGLIDVNPDVDSALINSSGALDVAIVKFDSLGNYLWSFSYGSPNDDVANELFVSPQKDVYTVGFFSTSADFDPDTTSSFVLGSSGGYIAKYSQNFCADLIILVDSISDLTCSTPGYISVSTVGLGNISYTWSSFSSDSSIYCNTPGIYTVNAGSVINNCYRQKSFLINGPIEFTGFDLNSNLNDNISRQGTNSKIWLNIFNDSCVPVSGNVMLVLDTILDFSSASPLPDSIIGDTLIWNFTNWDYNTPNFTPMINVFVPIWAPIGYGVCLELIASPITGDIDTTNNVKKYCRSIIASYDPNDKKVYPVGTCIPGYIENDQLLTYTVRFQNTGNASAIDVYVLDTLDSDLNLNSVRVIGNSHPLITEVLPGNVLKFRFDNINLADSTSNEAESHGYVIFEVLPNTGLSNGTTITNNVGIYFDYNPPVYTNTVLNTISDGTVNTNVSAIGNTITASLAGVSYQWLNCDNSNSVIAGATNQSYTAMASGNYSVIINDGCFVDTSACVSIFVTGISEVVNSNQFSFYPNPSNNTITITINEPTQIKIINMLGEAVLEKHVQNNSVIDIQNLSNGIYFIQTKGGYSTKLIKN